MDRVIDRVWIGSTEDFAAPLSSLGFTAVLDLRDGSSYVADKNVYVYRVDNRDGDPWTAEQVRGALDFVAAYAPAGKVLIACAAGMSRSACMTIGHLVRFGHDEATAFEMVRRARPKIAPVKKMLASVLDAVRATAPAIVKVTEMRAG